MLDGIAARTAAREREQRLGLAPRILAPAILMPRIILGEGDRLRVQHLLQVGDVECVHREGGGACSRLPWMVLPRCSQPSSRRTRIDACPAAPPAGTAGLLGAKANVGTFVDVDRSCKWWITCMFNILTILRVRGMGMRWVVVAVVVVGVWIGVGVGVLCMIYGCGCGCGAVGAGVGGCGSN